MKVGTTLLFGFLVSVVEALENLKMVFSVAERIKIATFYMTLLQERQSDNLQKKRLSLGPSFTRSKSFRFLSVGLCEYNVCAERHNTIFQLKRTVEQFVRSIPVQMCERVIQHFGARINRCLALRGGHIENIIVNR